MSNEITLTGIRPTKIPMTMLLEGRNEEEILSYMKDTYLVSEEKAGLSLEIAEREKELLSTIHYQDGYSLYIGIPFCPTTCLYCSFTSFPIVSWKKRVNEYLEAVEKEITFTAEIYKDKVLDTVYIGGGTPTTLSAEELERLLSFLKKTLDFSQVKEFTESRKRMHAAKDYSGAEIMRTLRDEVLNRGIEVVDFTSAIELIKDENGNCAGAVLLNMETKELMVAKAKVVILATGGAGRLHYQGFPTSNHYGATADGLVLGYRAGAKLLYQDTLQYHPTGAAFPAQIYGALVTEKVRSVGAMLINAEGDSGCLRPCSLS